MKTDLSVLSNTQSPRIAIVGGGITGISAALKLTELLPGASVTLFERDQRLGGVLQTEHGRPGWLIERSADMFTTVDPVAKNLADRLGYGDELIGTQPQPKQSLIVHKGKLIPVPLGLSLLAPTRVWPLVSTPLLSVSGKLRLAREPFVARRKSEEDESLAAFTRRRMGNEVFDRLIQPLVGGIYTADPEKLSMQATLSRFVEMEKASGSLFAASRKLKGSTDRKAGGARYSAFLTPKQGFGHFIDFLVSKLPAGCIRHDAVQSLNYQSLNDQPLSQTSSVSGSPEYILKTATKEEAFDAVILATPSKQSAELLEGIDASITRRLQEIEYAGASVVVMGVKRKQIAKSVACYGFVVPAIEKRKIIATSFASNKFPGRAPEDHLLLRAFVGGALQPELADLSDGELVSIVQQELTDLIGLQGDPEFAEVVRWTNAMPQYHVGHVQRIKEIEGLVSKHPGLELAGKSYRGVGIPFCVRDGERAATAIAKLFDVQMSAK